MCKHRVEEADTSQDMGMASKVLLSPLWHRARQGPGGTARLSRETCGGANERERFLQHCQPTLRVQPGSEDGKSGWLGGYRINSGNLKE